MNKIIGNIISIIRNNNLNSNEIEQIIDFLEIEKINQSNIKKNPTILDHNSKSDRIERKSNKNPYEYGGQQKVYEQSILQFYDANSIRDINVESSLQQTALTHIPGQKSKSIINDRFMALPREHNVNNIVWNNNMPRGGITTRLDKFK